MRKTMLNALPLIVLAITAGLVLLQIQQARTIKANVFSSLVLKSQQQARNGLDRLFEPVTQHLAIIAGSLAAKAPDLADAAVLNAQLMPILEEVPQIASAILADSNGREYMLLRTPEGWLTRLTDAGMQGDRSQWSRWSSATESVEAWEEALDYDPRRRPWFRGAVDIAAPGSVYWTAPYKFFTSGRLGITASRRLPHASQDEQTLVTAFDVLLADISGLTMSLRSGEAGKSFVLSGAGEIIGVPDDPQFRHSGSIDASLLAPAGTFPVVMVRDAYAEWLDQERREARPFIFRSGATTWWASFWAYPLGNESLWMAVAVPESELVDQVGISGHALTTAIIAGGVLLALGLLVAARRYLETSAELASQGGIVGSLPSRVEDLGDEPAQRIAMLIRQGENERLELKSSVRWNFKAGRTGKEIELAWLKTVAAYLNSEGGVLLLGISDDGEVLGLDKDGFANDDMALRHIENLIVRHIGAACCPYVRSRVISMEDKQVLMIVCKAAPKPVFLRHDKGEDFYIRTGPVSRALAPSETLSYIKTKESTASS